MSELKTVTAEANTYYTVDCPNCGEYIDSTYQEDWDEGENFHYNLKIKCADCQEEFMVAMP